MRKLILLLLIAGIFFCDTTKVSIDVSAVQGFHNKMWLGTTIEWLADDSISSITASGVLYCDADWNFGAGLWDPDTAATSSPYGVPDSEYLAWSDSVHFGIIKIFTEPDWKCYVGPRNGDARSDSLPDRVCRFGLPEALAFCESLGVEPFIVYYNVSDTILVRADWDDMPDFDDSILVAPRRARYGIAKKRI